MGWVAEHSLETTTEFLAGRAESWSSRPSGCPASSTSRSATTRPTSPAAPSRPGFTEHRRLPAERIAPAKTGEDLFWRLTRSEHAGTD